MYQYDPEEDARQRAILQEQHAQLKQQLVDVTPDKLMVYTVATLRVEASRMRLDGQRVGGTTTKHDLIEFLCACRRRDLNAQLVEVERKIAEVSLPEYMLPPKSEWKRS